jgi:hypothetical protein
MTTVHIPPDARLQLQRCWAAQDALRQQLYPTFGQWLALVEQVLSRDIRSVHQRLRSCCGAAGNEPPGGVADDALSHAPKSDPLQQPSEPEQDPQVGAASPERPVDSEISQQDGQGWMPGHDKQTEGFAYQVVLQGVRVWYDVTAMKEVMVQRAELL